MAIDVYLQIDGIKGESADVAHPGWIECLSVNWAISQPKSATSSTGGGQQTCAMGRTIPKAKFEFLRADGQGERIKYYEIELENVLIGHVAPSIEAGSILSENVGLKFSKVHWRYTQQRVSGGSSGNTSGGWDLATNRVG